MALDCVFCLLCRGMFWWVAGLWRMYLAVVGLFCEARGLYYAQPLTFVGLGGFDGGMFFCVFWGISLCLGL